MCVLSFGKATLRADFNEHTPHAVRTMTLFDISLLQHIILRIDPNISVCNHANQQGQTGSISFLSVLQGFNDWSIEAALKQNRP